MRDIYSRVILQTVRYDDHICTQIPSSKYTKVCRIKLVCCLDTILTTQIDKSATKSLDLCMSQSVTHLWCWPLDWASRAR